MSSFSFTPINKQTTRVGYNTNSCIDHVFLHYKHVNSVSAAIFDVGLPDHFLIALKVNYKGNLGTMKEEIILYLLC